MAHVFAFWRSREDHQAFLEGPHDGFASAQQGSYGAIDVRLFDHELDMGGPRDGELVRLAHCHVRPGREDHFRRAQADVWRPGMTAAGMRGGVFGGGGAGWLVLSWWQAPDHERYQAERFAELRDAAHAVDDLAAIAGDLVALEPSWAVPSAV